MVSLSMADLLPKLFKKVMPPRKRCTEHGLTYGKPNWTDYTLQPIEIYGENAKYFTSAEVDIYVAVNH